MLTNKMSRNSIAETLTAIFVFLFLYTGLSKYIDFINFKSTLGESPLIGKAAGFVATVLPGIEILIAIMMILPRVRVYGLYLFLSLMCVFTCYLVYMISFTPNLPCTCGGVIGQLSWKQHVFFNIGFIALSVIAISLQRKLLKGPGSDADATYA